MKKRENSCISINKGKQNALFVSLAVQIASSPDFLRDLIRHTVFGVELSNPLPPPPPLPVWLTMYRSHRKMQNALAIADGFPGEIGASEMLDSLRATSRMTQEEVTAEIEAEIAHFTKEQLNGLMTIFSGIPFPPNEATIRVILEELDTDSHCADSDEEDSVDAVLESPEGQYYLRVWWPCWFLYREYPPRLLRAARQGDIDALDRLLRLDKFIVGDPGVAKRLGEYFNTGTPGQRKQLTAALDGKPKKRLTDKAIRSGLGALISQLAFMFKTSVTAPQIEELFNRIERIRSGRLTDPAVPTGENWAKALQRNRDWPSLPTTKPDNKSPD